MGVHSEDFVMLACTILIQSQSVTYGQTHTDTHAITKTCKAFCCYA